MKTAWVSRSALDVAEQRTNDALTLLREERARADLLIQQMSQMVKEGFRTPIQPIAPTYESIPDEIELAIASCPASGDRQMVRRLSEHARALLAQGKAPAEVAHAIAAGGDGE